MAHKEAPQPVQLGGEPLDRILHATRPTLVSRVLAELQAQIPAYQKLPAEQLAGDIAQVTAHNMELIARMMRTGQPPSADELATIRESAARRAEEGIPIELVQTAYHVGALAVWDAITRDVRPEDATNVAAAARLVVRYLQSVTPEVAAGYLEERQVISGDEQLTRHALFAALLEGGDLADAAERAGVPLPAAYLVLSVNVGAHPDESTPGVDATVAGRRKLRRLRTELQRQVREPVLASLATDHGTALLPAAPPVDWDWVRQAVASAGRAAGAEITVGAEVAAPPGVADAARIAREVLEVAAMLGRPPGVYRLDDVLLEYQLSRPSGARDRLAGLLDALDGHPELLETLTVFVRRGRGRRPTATALHLHPNTVDYRLRKVASLTGLDPMNPAYAALLEAALTARAARAS